jgi:hypothetical protein
MSADLKKPDFYFQEKFSDAYICRYVIMVRVDEKFSERHITTIVRVVALRILASLAQK